jgi:hypothetical protein
MVVFDIHPWLRMSTGLILGGWIGVPVGCAMTVLFSARRLHQLEAANVMLRTRLRTREKAQRPSSILVMPPAASSRAGDAPRRAAGGR